MSQAQTKARGHIATGGVGRGDISHRPDRLVLSRQRGSTALGYGPHLVARCARESLSIHYRPLTSMVAGRRWFDTSARLTSEARSIGVGRAPEPSNEGD